MVRLLIIEGFLEESLSRTPLSGRFTKNDLTKKSI